MEALTLVPIAVDCVLEDHFVVAHISAVKADKLIDHVVRVLYILQITCIFAFNWLVCLDFAVVEGLEP